MERYVKKYLVRQYLDRNNEEDFINLEVFTDHKKLINFLEDLMINATTFCTIITYLENEKDDSDRFVVSEDLI